MGQWTRRDGGRTAGQVGVGLLVGWGVGLRAGWLGGPAGQVRVGCWPGEGEMLGWYGQGVRNVYTPLKCECMGRVKNALQTEWDRKVGGKLREITGWRNVKVGWRKV